MLTPTPASRDHMTSASLRYVVPLAFSLVAAIAVTIIEGTPRPLPAVALGSAVLLHALRVTALYAIGFAITTVFARAVAGRLPTQLSTTGVGYDAEEPAVTTATFAALQEQVAHLEAALDRLAELDKPTDPT
jgi:hypothetical protein